MIIDRFYHFLNCSKYGNDVIINDRFNPNNHEPGYLLIPNIQGLGDLLIPGIGYGLGDSPIPRKVFKENNYNTKLLYDIIKKMKKYVCEPSNFKLNIIKDLLSRVTLFSYDYDFYSHFCEILTRSHCDLKLFEATKFFIFRLYQAGFYFEEDNPDFNRLFIFNKKGQYNREFAHP